LLTCADLSPFSIKLTPDSYDNDLWNDYAKTLPNPKILDF